MKRNYPIGQRLMAYILLISLFLQSCNNPFISNIPIRPETIKEKRPSTSSSLASSQEEPLEEKATVNKSEGEPMALGLAPSNVLEERLVIFKTQDFIQIESPSFQEEQNSKPEIRLVTSERVKANRPQPSNFKKDRTLTLERKPALLQEQKRLNKSIRRSKDRRKTNPSSQFLKEATQVADQLAPTSFVSPRKPEFDKKEGPKPFLSKGGHKVLFQQLPSGQWQAVVEESLPAGIKRTLLLPVYLETGLSMNALAKYKDHEAWQKNHIHVVSQNSRSFMWVGSWGLPGGMKEDYDELPPLEEVPLSTTADNNSVTRESIKQNDISTTSSTILPGSIFHTDNLDNLIVGAINQSILANGLYKLRAEKIRAIIGKDINELCHKNEIQIINRMVELLQQLPTQLKGKDNQKLHTTCKQIFRLAYNYILYRVNGILKHLNTGNVGIFYEKNAEASSSIYCSPNWGDIYITTTFKEHKAGRLKEIDAYYKKPEVISALQALHQLVPALFYQQQSLDELWLESKNPFSEPGINFVEPPFLTELNELIKFVGLVHTNKHTAETLTDLNHITQKFTAKKDSRHVLELLGQVYTPIECLAFWPQFNQISQQEEQFLRLCLGIGIAFPKIISYDMLGIGEKEIKQAKKTLESSNTTLEGKVEAGRILLYSRIPWYLIRNISALLLKSINSADLKEKTIILEATKALGHAWQSLLPALQELITFEVSVITEQVNISPNQYQPLDESQYLPLTYLGNYTGDILFLDKISSTLGELDFKKPFFTETYLRLLGILGECAKNLSPHIKKLIGKDYWQKLADIRDETIHATGYLRRMQKVLEQKIELTEALKTELQLLLLQVQSVQQQLPNTWSGIKQFYGQKLDTMQKLPSNLGIELNNLQEALNHVLTEADYKELRSTKQYIPTELEEKRDQILKVLNKETEAKAIEQVVFFALVDALYTMPVNQKDKIKEAYKKLRQGKEVNLTPAIIKGLQEVKSITDKGMDSHIEELIKKLKKCSNFSGLEKDLAKEGLIGAKDIWEEKRKKFFAKVNNKTSKQKDLSSQTLDLDKVLLDSIDAAKNILRLLEALEKLVHSKDSTNMLPLEQFWNDPILCQAVEFHFTRLRTYTNIIQEALSYLPRYDIVHETILALNSLYHSLSIKLQKTRLYGNSLAHLHDVTHFDGRTILGHRLTAYQELWSALEDYKALNSIKTNITRFVEILTKGVETANKNRAAKLEENRKSYQTMYKWQQQALAKLPILSLSDYQILSTFSKIDDSDPHKPIKQQLYTATEKLFSLHQEFVRLQNVSPISSSAKRSSSATKYANVAGQKLFFQETSIVGDGWCTLNAIGVADPSGAINLLKNQLHNPHIIRYIRNAIENNYQASLALGEEFDIVGKDNQGNNIKDEIIALYLDCQNDNPTAHLDMLDYLERPEVQIAYLDYLLKTRYVDSNIAAACLLSQGKKLALFIDYNLPDGQLINSVEDNVSPSDPNTVCLVFHPNSRHASAHYNLLNIITMDSQNFSNIQQKQNK